MKKEFDITNERMEIPYMVMAGGQEVNTGLINFNEDEEIKKLMPASGKIYDFVFGPNHRKKGESFKQYKLRRKVENYMFGYRLRGGVNIWTADKGTFTDPGKQQRKSVRKIRKMALRKKFREYKFDHQERMTPEQVKEYTAVWS